MNITFYLSGISLVFIIFQLIFPYTPPKGTDFLNITENSKKYKRLESLAILWIFLSIGLISFLTFLFGSQLRDNLFPASYNYLIIPTNSFWFFPGFILGFGLIRIPMEFIYKLILKENYHNYIQYTNMKHGFDGEKFWRPIEKILTIAGLTIFILGLTWYVRIDNKGKIEFNELISLKTRTYDISNIERITFIDTVVTKKEKAKNIKYFEIELIDNYKWNSQAYDFFALQNDREYLCEKMEELSTITKKLIN